jgi:hypothetical protein
VLTHRGSALASIKQVIEIIGAPKENTTAFFGDFWLDFSMP